MSRRLNIFIVDKYNRYTCPLLLCRHLTLKLLIQGHPRNAKVPHVSDFKSAYISLIIASKGWGGNLLMCSDLTLDSLFKVKRGKPNLKVLITRLLLD